MYLDRVPYPPRSTLAKVEQWNGELHVRLVHEIYSTYLGMYFVPTVGVCRTVKTRIHPGDSHRHVHIYTTTPLLVVAT